MLEHFKGEEVFVKKVFAYKEQAVYQQRLIVTPFLDPYYQRIVRSVVEGDSDLQLHEEGGFTTSESKKMIIAPTFYQIEKEDFEISIVKISYAKQFDTLRHSDILGALMSLGIKRDRFGDIIQDEDAFYVAMDAKLFSYVKDNLQKIKRSKVHMHESNADIKAKLQFKIQTHIVSSKRLDTVLSAFYNISRTKASSYIRAGFVKVNHKTVVEIHYLCNNKDIISFKKHGRVMFVDTNRMTKSDNCVIEGHKYV